MWSSILKGLRWVVEAVALTAQIVRYIIPVIREWKKGKSPKETIAEIKK